MAFYGCEFIFDGLPCSAYDLMIYNFGVPTENGNFSSTPTNIQEDRTAWRSTPLYYGTIRNTPLTFSLSFGINQKLIDKGRHLDRWEMDAIATWLTGEDGYKFLEIIQPDMDIIRYKCIITNLTYITVGGLPWGFDCAVTCDSPYAYTQPETITKNVSGSTNLIVDCRSATKFYYPRLTIAMEDGAVFKIINHSDKDRELSLTGLGEYSNTITIDNENEVIANTRGLNLYNNFNFTFFRLVRGMNEIEVVCDGCTLDIMCEYPINVGG